jgi:hypothetical protein
VERCKKCIACQGSYFEKGTVTAHPLSSYSELCKRPLYVHIDNTNKYCDLLQDRPAPSTGRTPHDKQNRNCLDCNQNLLMSPGGARSQEGLTD